MACLPFRQAPPPESARSRLRDRRRPPRPRPRLRQRRARRVASGRGEPCEVEQERLAQAVLARNERDAFGWLEGDFTEGADIVGVNRQEHRGLWRGIVLEAVTASKLTDGRGRSSQRELRRGSLAHAAGVAPFHA